MLTHFQYQLMLGVRLLIVEPMLKRSHSSMGLFILLKCSILHRFSNSSSFQFNHSRTSSMAIKIPVFLVGPPLLKSMHKISNKSLMLQLVPMVVLLVVVVVVEVCKVSLSPKIFPHSHSRCNSSIPGSSYQIIMLLIQLAKLSLRWGAKTARPLLIVAFPELR